MISVFINSFGLTAFLKLALVIYSVHGQIGQSIKGTIKNPLIQLHFSIINFFSIADSFSEFDLLTVALNDMENINNGGNGKLRNS